jgi:hypothetical protein
MGGQWKDDLMDGWMDGQVDEHTLENLVRVWYGVMCLIQPWVMVAWASSHAFFCHKRNHRQLQ